MPEDAASEAELSGLPWGSLSLKHVVSKGKAKEEEFGRGSKIRDDTSCYGQEPVYEERDAYYEGVASYYCYSGESCGDRPREGVNSRLMGESEPPSPDPADLTNAFTGLRIENS